MTWRDEGYLPDCPLCGKPQRKRLRHNCPLLSYRKPVCRRGHPLEGDNVYVAPKSGKHMCRACQRYRYEQQRAVAQ